MNISNLSDEGEEGESEQQAPLVAGWCKLYNLGDFGLSLYIFYLIAGHLFNINQKYQRNCLFMIWALAL